MDCKYYIDGKEFDRDGFLGYVKTLDAKEVSKVFPKAKDADGKKVLFLEEVQSDWGQKGKKEGFETPEKKAELKKLQDEVSSATQKFNEIEEELDRHYANNKKEGESRSDLRKRDSYFNKLAQEYAPAEQRMDESRRAFDLFQVDNRGEVPAAPFISDTNAWTKLGLKVALKEAVKQGTDKIAWSTGTQQFDRWGSEKISWKKEGNKWKIDLKEQESGNAFDGINIDEKALAESNVSVSSKEQLKEVLNRNLRRERNEAEIDKLTERIWNRMQTEDSGTSLPRKEGMEEFYGNPADMERAKDFTIKKEGELFAVKNENGNTIRTFKQENEANKFKENYGLGIVGNVAKSLFKQEVGTVEVEVGDSGYTLTLKDTDTGRTTTNQFDNKQKASAWLTKEVNAGKNYEVVSEESGKRNSTQHSIDITPELKAEVELGLPLFAMASTTIPLIDDIKQAPELGISKVTIARRSFPIEYNILKNKIKGRMNALGDTVPKSIAVSDFLTEYMNDLLNRTSKNADGTEKRFAFVDKLENMRNSLSSASNTPLLESIYDHIQDGTPITKKASEILSTLTDYHIQFQNVIAMNDAVAIDNDTIYDRDEFKSQALSELKKGRDAVQLKKLEGSKYGKYIAIGIEKYTLAVSSLSTWAKLLAGGENSMLNKLVKTLDAAQDKQYVMAETARDMINGLQKKIGKGSTFNSNDILKSATQQIGTIFSNHKGDNTLISEGELLHIYLTLKNDVARARFFDGGGNGIFELKEFRDKQDKVLRKNVSLNITSADYKTLENRFASADWQSKIDDWTKANKFLYNYVNDVHLQDTGTALKQVPGFYYPLVHGDGIKSYEDYLTSNKFMDDLRSTKSRSPEKNANYLVVDAVQLMDTYINTNSKYAAYAMPLKNIDVYLKEADSFIRDNDMLRYVEWYNKFKKEFEDPSPDKLGEIGKRLLSRFVISRLGLNPFVTLKQYSSLFIANNVIPYKYIISSLDVLGKNAGGVIKSFVPGLKVEFDDVMNEMLEHSATARRRLNAGQNYFDELVKSGIKDYETVVFGKNIKVPFSKMTQNISAADRAVSSVYWVAAKKQVASETSLSVGSKEYWNAVNDIYSEAVVQSQSSIDDVNRAHITKDANILVKGLTLFSGQAFSNYNSFMGNVIEHANNPNSSNKMRLARSIMNVYVYNALMVAAIDSLKYAQNGDDEDKLKKKAMRSMISNSYQNLPILAPIIDQVWSKVDDPRFSRDINYPVLQVINDGASLIGNLANEKYERAVIEGIKFGAEGIGIPMYPFDAANKIITKK